MAAWSWIGGEGGQKRPMRSPWSFPRKTYRWSGPGWSWWEQTRLWLIRWSRITIVFPSGVHAGSEGKRWIRQHCSVSNDANGWVLGRTTERHPVKETCVDLVFLLYSYNLYNGFWTQKGLHKLLDKRMDGWMGEGWMDGEHTKSTGSLQPREESFGRRG